MRFSLLQLIAHPRVQACSIEKVAIIVSSQGSNSRQSYTRLPGTGNPPMGIKISFGLDSVVQNKTLTLYERCGDVDGAIGYYVITGSTPYG